MEDWIPVQLRQVQQTVRSSQAARGLGNGPGDAAQENYYVGQTMDARRAANQNFAQNIGMMQQNAYKDPFSVAAGLGLGGQQGPMLTNSGVESSLLAMPYQGGLQANEATAANNTGLLKQVDSSSASFLGSL
jgi:hypothetical protein